MNREQLYQQIIKKRSYLCVGLDTDLSKIPDCLKHCDNPMVSFNKRIIDVTAPYAIAYKPNAAFYESMGAYGISALQETIAYIKENYPDIFVIVDAKRGDIGAISNRYATTCFDVMHADALTVSPYMGRDSIAPFLQYSDKWTIVLALTGNEGTSDFQHISIGDDGKCLYQMIIEKSLQWGSSDNMMFLTGTTKAEHFQKIREIAPDNFLLVTGIGADAESIDDIAEYGMNDHCGLIVNASAVIIYGDTGEHFAMKAAESTKLIQIAMEKSLVDKGLL